jgi:hypothetical protein
MPARRRIDKTQDPVHVVVEGRVPRQTEGALEKLLRVDHSNRKRLENLNKLIGSSDVRRVHVESLVTALSEVGERNNRAETW